MKFDLSRFLDGDDAVFPIEGEVDSKSLNSDNSDYEIIGPIKFKGEIFKVDGEFLVNARLWYDYNSHCDRCLQPSTEKIKINISGKLAIKNGVFDEEDGYDEFLYLDDEGVLDISQFILSETEGSLPMKFLCDEDCKGLCSQCGIDLNKNTCDCENNSIDPRFEKLKDLFPEK